MEDISAYDETNDSEIVRIIQYNHDIRQIIQDQTNKFLVLKNDLIKNLQTQQINENPIIQNNDTFLDTIPIESLNEQVTSSKLQLALVGTNSCGKTSFLHFLLRSGNFLPTDVGPVSARIIRLTYANAENAALYVYQSLNSKQIYQQVSLKEFFFNRQEPDWDGMKTAIHDYVTRPNTESIKADSDAFAKWAKFFIEIQIPSSFLKLGIDVYDTPGLVFSDALVLKENLCQLVKLVKPTLVFMYDNAAVASDTRDCFLALKDAIGQVTDTSIFFLNTKADIERILADADPNNQGIDDEKVIKILFNEREKRYQLLLNVPSMTSEFFGGELPKSILDCPFFDIVSVHSDFDELGAQLNQTTVNRLIQFTANSDLKIATKISRLVLPMIDAFFDLALTTNHRTTQQFKTLLSEALQWTENYYVKYRNFIEQLLMELYNNILEQLRNQENDIAKRASRYESIVLIENYIKTVLQQDIIKIEIENIKKKYMDVSFLDKIVDSYLLGIAQKNEFLIAAQRDSNWLFDSQIKQRIDKKFARRIFAEQTILSQILLITDVLIESNDKEKRTSSLSNYKQLFNRKTSLGKEIISTLEVAKERLVEVSLWLINQKTYIHEIIDAGYFVEKAGFIKKIHQYHHLANQSLVQREKLYKLIKKYSQDFASIQCRILSALNLAKFNGIIPSIDQTQSFGEHIYLAKWMNDTEFLAKKTEDYLEIHSYLKLMQLRIPNILPLISLSEDKETNSFWIFFPKFHQKLKDINLTVDNLFEISYDIVDTLAHLHFNQLVHGNMRIENIFFDKNNQCYLTNFHFDKSYQFGISNDVYNFGQLGKYLYERVIENYDSILEEDLDNLGDFKNLFNKCLDSDINKRPKAAILGQQIKEIRKNL